MTMYRYRSGKNPIEAFQMTREAREDFASWPEWLKEAREDARTGEGSIQCLTPQARKGMLTLTMAGREILIRWDYWIIHNPDTGHTDVLSPAQFAEQFEVVPEYRPFLSVANALEWAKEHRCHIEIFCNGSAEVQFEGPFENYGEFYAQMDGETLLGAINNARNFYRDVLEGTEV